jgi:hypothetical protein
MTVTPLGRLWGPLLGTTGSEWESAKVEKQEQELGWEPFLFRSVSDSGLGPAFPVTKS